MVEIVDKQEEYVAPSGQTVTIQHNVTTGRWEVACWNPDETNHWYLEFGDEEAARSEYGRWRT